MKRRATSRLEKETQSRGTENSERVIDLKTIVVSPVTFDLKVGDAFRHATRHTAPRMLWWNATQGRFRPQRGANMLLASTVTVKLRASGSSPPTTRIPPSLPLSHHDSDHSPPLLRHPRFVRNGECLFAYLRSTQLVALPPAPESRPIPLIHVCRPLCNRCPNDRAICCPFTVDCGDDGHCPQEAVVAAGWTIGGEDMDGRIVGGVEITD